MNMTAALIYDLFREAAKAQWKVMDHHLPVADTISTILLNNKSSNSRANMGLSWMMTMTMICGNTYLCKILWRDIFLRIFGL
jgi:hypothetical protein